MNKPKLAVCITSLGASDKEMNQLPPLIKKLENYFTDIQVENVDAQDLFDSQTVALRIESINSAFKNADIVIAFNGGYNSIELFEQFEQIQDSKNKIFIGYSDNTLLANALPASGKSRGWLGSMIASMLSYPVYVDLWAQNILSWYNNDFNAVSMQYNGCGMKVMNAGLMKGIVIGGNAYTFDLLQGTLFCPSFEQPFIYILEGEDFIVDKSRVWQDTIRNLDSVILQPGARDNLKGLLIGKFPETYTLNEPELFASIKKRDYLSDVPVVWDFPRGYGQPGLCLPLAEPLQIQAFPNNTISINRL